MIDHIEKGLTVTQSVTKSKVTKIEAISRIETKEKFITIILQLRTPQTLNIHKVSGHFIRFMCRTPQTVWAHVHFTHPR